jgi:hypothetical protein
MSWLYLTLLIPALKIVTSVAVNLLRLVMALFVLLVILTAASAAFRIPMPWLDHLLQLVRYYSSVI